LIENFASKTGKSCTIKCAFHKNPGKNYGGYSRMTEKKNTITVRAILEMTPGSLEAIVENAKIIAGRDERGRYRVDTADKVGEMISRFLIEKDFESYVKDIDNFPR
jgi:hypothetical protein